VLTGATGSLGAHLLAKLAQLDDVKTIYCLVRATSDSEARKRVVRSLRERKLYHTLSVPQRRKIVSLSSNLALPGLGLDPERYEQIAGQITALYHCAWSVNFNLKLSSFEKESIAGMKNLIDLCLKSRGEKPARFAFSSSVGTVLRTTKKMVPEALPEGFSSTQPTGYAQSKLVSEHICVKAIAETGLPAYILRVGQIVGDTKHGVWNSSEAVPLMLQTSKTIGSLPTIDESLRWLPVDDVAQTMIEITTSDAAGSGFFNLLNPNTFHWTRDLLPYLSRAGLTFDELDPPSWLNVLRASDSDVTANPPVKLLEYLTSNYDTTAPRRTFEFETENAQRFSSTFRNVAAPDEELIGKIVRHFTSACWKTSSAQNGAPSPQTAVIVHGPDSTETDTLATELASQLDMPILRGDVSETAEGGLGTPIIIDAGPLTKGDRDRLRKELNCPTIFLMLQHGTPAESALTPDDEEVDVIPLDATVEHSELLEDAASWVRDFVEV
jgi:thioester reductase-like protein